MRDDIEVKTAGEADREWIRRQLTENWGGHMVVLRGELLDVTRYPALIAGDREGLLHYRALDRDVCEIVTLEAFRTGRGIGTVLVETLAARARADGHRRLLVVTTNDNLDALRFYQARGFRLQALRPGAVEAARRLKPEIAPTGNYGLPIRDELELAREL
ncbi:GNAT family N-acetyltransferase [Devosia sp.]|uniref:GNAT family N-acetyltransferase n=1 Tax=Devosia sp. TaxID=1871048 RepID=UPI002EEBDC1C